jgi:hypothetical protein
MSQNQELVSFPFKPYLAKYLFHVAKNEVIETEEALYKHLDINLKNPDARFIRIMMERKTIPGIQTFPSKGFRFTVRIPKYSKEHYNIIEDSRTKAILIDEETAELIHDHYDAKFRDHFCAFVAGAIHGSGYSRKSMTEAVTFFMDEYQLDKKDPDYSFDRLVKLFKRKNMPLKGIIYGKNSG